jgi:hypothetical protein
LPTTAILPRSTRRDHSTALASTDVRLSGQRFAVSGERCPADCERTTTARSRGRSPPRRGRS